MHRWLLPLLLAMPLLGGSSDSPVGTWKTIDDATGQQKALVEITETNGELSGRILKTFRKDRPNPLCDKCEGERKGKPILGMTIFWGLRRNGDDYQGGFILDPDNGKIYKAKLKVIEDGKKLSMRGFIGISLIGRTQTWVRDN